jgi:hypothetical protein
MIRKEEALQHVLKYLGEQYKGKLGLTEGVPLNLYWPGNRADYWSVHIPTIQPQELHVGVGRLLIVSKQTGEIVYDGSDGME